LVLLTKLWKKEIEQQHLGFFTTSA